MHITAEIRWFWPDCPPPGLDAWFRDAALHGCPAGGGDRRLDEYLYQPGQAELGLKRRGGGDGVEIKGLLSVAPDALKAGPFAGSPERWVKWESPALSLEGRQLIRLTKRRWLRTFDCTRDETKALALGPDENPLGRPMPERGCNVELTELTLEGGGPWWTFGLEAFGVFEQVEHDLRRVAAELAAAHPPLPSGGALASYPRWLAER
jgi:hypothetical protein